MSTIGITTYYYKRDDLSSLSCLEQLDGLYYLDGDRYIIDEATCTYTSLPSHEQEDTTRRIVLIALSCLIVVGLIPYAIVLIRRCYYHYQLKSFTQIEITQPQNKPLEQLFNKTIEQTALKQEPLQTSKAEEEPQESQEIQSVSDNLSMPWYEMAKQPALKQEPLQTSKAEEEPQESQKKQSVPGMSMDEMVAGWDEMRARDKASNNLLDLAVKVAAAKGPTEKAIHVLDRSTHFFELQRYFVKAFESKDAAQIESAIAYFVKALGEYSKEYTLRCEKHEGSVSAARSDALSNTIYMQLNEAMAEVQYAFKSISLSQPKILTLWWTLITRCSTSSPASHLKIFADATCAYHNGDPEYIQWAGGYTALQNYYKQMRHSYLSVYKEASEEETHLYAQNQLIRLLSRLLEERVEYFNEYMIKPTITEHLKTNKDSNDPIWQTVEIAKNLPFFSHPECAEVQIFIKQIFETGYKV